MYVDSYLCPLALPYQLKVLFSKHLHSTSVISFPLSQVIYFICSTLGFFFSHAHLSFSPSSYSVFYLYTYREYLHTGKHRHRHYLNSQRYSLVLHEIAYICAKSGMIHQPMIELVIGLEEECGCKKKKRRSRQYRKKGPEHSEA